MNRCVVEVWHVLMAGRASDSIINAIVLYYKKRKKGDQYTVKEHVRVKIPQEGPALRGCVWGGRRHPPENFSRQNCEVSLRCISLMQNALHA